MYTPNKTNMLLKKNYNMMMSNSVSL